MERLLARQIERILDEDLGQVHEVIVEMELPGEDLHPLIDAGRRALQRRAMAPRARSVAPSPADLLRETRPYSNHDRRRLRDSGMSLAAQAALAAEMAGSRPTIGGNGAVAPILAELMNSAVVREAINGSGKRGRRAAGRNDASEGFKSFWSSGSAALRLSKEGLRRLPEEVAGVRSVVVNRRVSLPPYAAAEPAAADTGDIASSWGVEHIGALAAWGAYGTKGEDSNGGRPVKIAVLDTGVDPEHPVLAGRIVDWAEFAADGRQVRGSKPHDSDIHGTHVCGIVAGGFDTENRRWIGVAPSVEIAAGLVLPGGSGRDSQILAGIDWALEHGAEIINMSLGGISFDPYVADIYTRAILSANARGVPVVVAIGNEGSQTSGSPGNHMFALSVGATDRHDRAAGFSGGRTQVITESRYLPPSELPLIYSKPDVTAPGVEVRSCVPGGKFEILNGTSMAAPHVTGAIALLLAATTIREVPANRRAFLLQDLIISSVDELGEVGQDHRFGFGRINVLRAISLAKELGY